MISFTRGLPEETCPRCNTPGAIAPRDLSVWLLATVMLISVTYLVARLTWVGRMPDLAVTAVSLLSLTVLGLSLIHI